MKSYICEDTILFSTHIMLVMFRDYTQFILALHDFLPINFFPLLGTALQNFGVVSRDNERFCA